MPTAKRADAVPRAVAFWTVVALCGLGVAGIAGSIHLGVWGRQGPGSGLFPLLASILIVVCSLPRIFIRRPPADDTPPTNWRRLGFYVLGLLVFVVLFGIAGFPISSLVAIMIILSLAERQPIAVCIGFTLLITVVSLVLFDYVLNVPLPWGPLSFLRVWT